MEGKLHNGEGIVQSSYWKEKICFKLSIKKMRNLNKHTIQKNICYTELVYERINKKLDKHLNKDDIERLITKLINETDIEFFEKKGKNIYMKNTDYNIRVTINKNTYRVITVDKLKK